MIMRISKQRFIDLFPLMGRGEKFTYGGLDALYDFLEEEFDEGYELDVIALCCQFTEYESLEDACDDIGRDVEIVAQFEGGVIILNN